MESEREIFVPNELLIQTFSYLEVADVRSCRLVCRRWYICCEDKMITRAEKFVFRSDINLTAEINEFLINLQRDKVNVELVRIDLRELNFELFGSKIEELELKECIVDVDTFKNLFYATPNMTQFHLSTQTVVTRDLWDEWIPMRSDEVWARGVNLLHEEKFQNVNMIEFKWDADVTKYSMDRLGCRLSPFLFIFPRLRSIHLWKSFTPYDIPELRNFLSTTNITCLGGTFDMDLDCIDHSETFALFSRLKIVHLNIDFFTLKRSSLSLCDRLFSQMADVEELTCKFRSYEEGNRGEVTKAVLFQILESCLKLTKLSFSTSSTNRHIYLNREEMLEFMSSIKKIKSLKILTMMWVDESDTGEPIVTLSDTDGRLKNLHFDSFYGDSFYGPSDMGYRIMETYQLTALSLSTYPECFSTILQSQKCLQRLEITIISIKSFSKSKMDMNLKEVIPLKHERLNHLVYKFDGCGRNFSKYDFGRLFTCELPNLRTLRLDAGIDDSEDEDSEDDDSTVLDSEDDDSKVHDSQDDDSEDDDSEVDDSEDNDSDVHNSEVDDSEDDNSEVDDSEDDDSEEDDSEVDDSEDNDYEIDDNEVHNSDDNDSKVHDSEVHNSEDDDSNSGLKNVLKKWLGKMTTLTQIDLKLPRDLLNFEESLQVFVEMRHLHKIVWTSTDPCRYNPSQEIKNLFVLQPNLRSFHYSDEDDDDTKGWIYKYHRSKQQLFQQIVINGDTIKNSYNLVL